MYWVYGQPERPVRQMDLQAAYLDGDSYRADVMAAFDRNGDGRLDETELRLDTPEKEALIKQNLEALGLDNLQIKAEVQPYTSATTLPTASGPPKSAPPATAVIRG